MNRAFRAAYADFNNNGAGVLLTRREHARLTDDALIAEAKAEAARAGIDLEGADIVIGESMDSICVS